MAKKHKKKGSKKRAEPTTTIPPPIEEPEEDDSGDDTVPPEEESIPEKPLPLAPPPLIESPTVAPLLSPATIPPILTTKSPTTVLPSVPPVVTVPPVPITNPPTVLPPSVPPSAPPTTHQTTKKYSSTKPQGTAPPSIGNRTTAGPNDITEIQDLRSERGPTNESMKQLRSQVLHLKQDLANAHSGIETTTIKKSPQLPFFFVSASLVFCILAIAVLIYCLVRKTRKPKESESDSKVGKFKRLFKKSKKGDLDPEGANRPAKNWPDSLDQSKKRRDDMPTDETQLSADDAKTDKTQSYTLEDRIVNVKEKRKPILRNQARRTDDSESTSESTEPENKRRAGAAQKANTGVQFRIKKRADGNGGTKTVFISEKLKSDGKGVTTVKRTKKIYQRTPLKKASTATSGSAKKLGKKSTSLVKQKQKSDWVNYEPTQDYTDQTQSNSRSSYMMGRKEEIGQSKQRPKSKTQKILKRPKKLAMSKGPQQ